MSGGTSGPYGIRRMALQVEMTDGRIMSFYAGEEQAAEHGATIDVEHKAPGIMFSGATPPSVYQIRVNSLGGYIMTLREPRPGDDELLQQPKEIEQ